MALTLVTGATGYVGGRLLKRFEENSIPVRCLARNPEYLRSKAAPGTQVVKADVSDRDSLPAALHGVETAYYLVHSMGLGKDFEERDRAAARNFAEASKKAGVKRIIYLGGLGDTAKPLSPHLRSRQEVGEILRGSGCQVIEFRASIVIGSGSLSFEMIRALVERLPVMVTPRWVRVPAQPIGIDDLLEYLVQARDIPVEGSPIFEIGGGDQVSYEWLMKEYARQRGLKRVMIPVPVLSPWVSSLWLGLVTPLFARIGRVLIESIRHSTIVRDPKALRVFPVKPMDIRAAIEAAFKNEDKEFSQTRWSDSVSSAGKKETWGGERFGNRLVDLKTAEVSVPPEKAFWPIQRIGGKNGWYFAGWLWRLRGFLDILAGGVGMRRGRRHPVELKAGDSIDCWRVESYDPGRSLRLAAEMKLPGRAWLSFEVQRTQNGSKIVQTAIFDPIGILGLSYWYLIWPVHQLVFKGMLRGIVRNIKTA